MTRIPCPRRLFSTALLSATLALPAAATTTTFGDVENNEPGSGDITVGYATSSDDFAFGQLFIDGGSAETFGEMVVGNQELAIGEVTVTGVGTSLTLTSGGSSSSQALLVGEEGTGTVTVSDGAVLNISSLSEGTLEIGEQTTGYGRVTVDGRSASGVPTRLIVAENVIVGGAGIGELTISGGALVNHTDTNSAVLTIGEAATGHGLVTVTGSNTLWQAPELISIGVVGSGELRIADGAVFDADNGLVQTTTVGTRGYVNLQGGRFWTDGATVNGRLGGGGWVSGPITVSTTGELSAGPGQKLQFLGNVANSGLIDVAGTPESRSEIEFLGTLTNVAGTPPVLDGRIAVADGVLRLSQTLTNNGTLASTGGDTDFHGNITNGATGLIAIGGESNATFYDDVDVTAGALNIATGSTALFLGDITISPGSNLSITVDASALEEGFDTPLQVLGTTTLGAPITLELEDGFVPEAGDTIPLLAAAGGFALDTLSTQDFEPLPAGLSWEVLPTNDGLIAQVVSVPVGPAGDFNGDGMVTAADYALGRSLVGLQDPSPADADGSGTVDAADLAIWRQDFGSVAPAIGGPSTSTVVPEPNCLLLALAGVAAAPVRRKQ